MDVAGKHDMRGAQPRRRRHDALANARGIDADDRRVLENARAGPPRQGGEAMDVFATVDLERLRIIHAVEVAIGLELIADAIDLPAFDLGLEILAQHLQSADQLIAGIDIGDLERALAQADAGNKLLPGKRADELRPFPGQRPELAGVLEADAFDQLPDRKPKSRHHRAELMAGGVPADMPAFEHGDTGAEPRGFE